MTIEFSFFSHLSIKRVLLQNSFFQLNCLTFPHCGPLLKSHKGNIDALLLTGSASRTDLSQLANGIWEIHAGCPSFLRVSSVAKIGYIPQFKASNARDQDEVPSDPDLARMQINVYANRFNSVVSVYPKADQSLS